ncbi:uncharacterized protein SPSK_05726 [Sporothrix schenckii 1099-18]|uniref:Uncharacterized protein n=1 Tax=Sporothrix schenckii 1099-18 TaxID=1397361 RepID=A0A0F2LSX4_SPOSC|nr:uncharacterized protein SPSK_05726 [Sporothrix schenckii 1099-18]KJR80577.1 hypothetical protein SPSK_05726 [Sporothrix schenckii 1099-18]
MSESSTTLTVLNSRKRNFILIRTNQGLPTVGFVLSSSSLLPLLSSTSISTFSSIVRIILRNYSDCQTRSFALNASPPDRIGACPLLASSPASAVASDVP